MSKFCGVRMRQHARWPACLVLFFSSLLLTPACAASDLPQRVFIIGQDLGAVRAYMDSDCCPQPDANTAYLGLYNLLSENAGFGGLRINTAGEAIDTETTWGGGPVNAWKSATEFGPMGLAIGLSLTENDHPGALQRLVAGEYDAHIRHLATFLASVKGTVYLRIAYEFDGRWNQGYSDPELYKAAYRRVADGLAADDLAHVQFVWQASASPIDDLLDGQREDISQWYPGDEYVDWMAFSWFLHPDEQPGVAGAPRVPSQRELADEVLALARLHGKPVMIAEASPQGFNLSRNTHAFITPIWDGASSAGISAVTAADIWDAWFQPLFDYLHANGDVIQALAYINCHWDAQELWGPPYNEGYWGDSRLQLNPEIASRFTSAINAWRGNNP